MAYSDRRKKIDINLDRDMVDLMIMYALSDSPLINTRAIINLSKLVSSISFDDDVFEARLKFDLLRKLLILESEEHIFNLPIIKNELLKAFPENEEYVLSVIEDALANPIIESDILYINSFVEERLKYLFVFEYKNKLQACIDELEESSDMNAITGHFETVINGLYKSIQNSKAVSKDAAEDFCIGSGKLEKNFQPMLRRTISSINKPDNYIKTGVDKLNLLLGGGLEDGRCYIAYAPPKSWKSGLLMNFAIWACKYNTFVPKDPSKTPCVLLVSMENTPKETLKRLFSYTGRDLKEFDEKEASEIINKEIIGDRNIALECKYRRTQSISTQDLDAMIDDLALEGKEVVLLVQDYMKRIKSSSPDPDLRIELGNITNDFCSIARARDIPVLTAMQINRAGMAKIDGAVRANKTSLVKLLSKIDAGESALPLENTDYAFCIYPEEDNNGEKYLGVNSWVSRVEIKTEETFFLHPFDNGMKLKEDLGGPSLSIAENPSLTEGKFNTTTFDPAAARDKWLKAGGRIRTMTDELNDNEEEF